MYSVPPANTAILNIQILSGDITSDYGFLLQLLNTFTIGSDETLPNVLQSKWCQGPLKTLYLRLD